MLVRFSAPLAEEEEESKQQQRDSDKNCHKKSCSDRVIAPCTGRKARPKFRTEASSKFCSKPSIFLERTAKALPQILLDDRKGKRRGVTKKHYTTRQPHSKLGEKKPLD